MTRRRKKPKRRMNPRSLANLRRGGPGPGPAPLGNQPTRTHGAYAAISRETLGRNTREVFEAIAADVPRKDGAGELPAPDALPVRLLAGCLIRLESVSEYLNRRGWEAEDGTPRPAVEVEWRLRHEALDLAESLGRTPRSRARLGLDLQRGAAFDLAAHWQAESESIDGEAEEEGE